MRCARAVAAEAELADAIAKRRAAGLAYEAAVAGARFADVPAFDDAAVRKAFSKKVKAARAFARDLVEVVPEDALREVAAVIPAVADATAALRDAHDRWRDRQGAYARAFADDFAGARAALRRLYADDARLQEAVFLESPEAFARIQQLIGMDPGAPRNSRARQRERLAAMYAQRFCAKNDTNSICGPHGVAFLPEGDPGAPAAIAIVREDLRRATYFSHWAAQRLLDVAVERAGAAAMTLRRHPTVRLTGSTLAWCAMEHDATSVFRRRYARTELPDAAARLIEELARPRREAELLALADELEVDADDLAGLLDQLVARSVIVRGPVLAPGSFRPLRAVAAEVDGWPDGDARAWVLAEITAAEAAISEFAKAPLARRLALFEELSARFASATGGAATRGEGKHYVDRSILHEDTCVEVHANLGPHAATLDDTLPALIGALELPLALARERVREWFAARFGTTRVPALDVHRAFDEDRVLETAASTARAAALGDAIDRVRTTIERAASGGPGTPARLTAADLRAAVAGAPVPAHAGYVSADLMLRDVPAGEAAVVLGEIHGFFWLPTCLLDVLPQDRRDRVVEQMRACVREMAGGVRTAECVFLHTQATDRRFGLATTDLELVTRSDRPDAVAFGDLDLELADDVLVYRDRDGNEVVPLVAYSAYPFVLYTSRIAPMFDDFAERFFPDSLLPVALRGHDAPRLVVDDLVVRRRVWLRPCGETLAALTAASEAELFARAQAWRRALGCGDRVFVSVPGEPKPVLVDFGNAFLVEGLVNLLERRPADAQLKIGEMLPAPDELVTRGPDGARTSELRIGFYRA